MARETSQSGSAFMVLDEGRMLVALAQACYDLHIAVPGDESTSLIASEMEPDTFGKTLIEADPSSGRYRETLAAESALWEPVHSRETNVPAWAQFPVRILIGQFSVNR